jgi:type I restriction enzyme S subunit
MKAGWQTKKLGEICQIKPPKVEARRQVSESDLVSFVPMEDLGIDQKFLVSTRTKPLAEVIGSYTYFADGDVLLAKITPCFENRKLGIAANLTKGIGFGSSEYIVFRPGQSVNKEWLYYFLSRESFRKEGAAHMSGAVGHKRVPKEFIETYPIPLPPLPEQHRIVAILDEAFTGIATAKANAEKNIQNARELFESDLHSIFTQRGEGWVEKKLRDVCDVIAGQSPEGKFYNQEGRGRPFYQGKKEFGEKYIGQPTTWTTQTTKIAVKYDILISVRAPVGPINYSTEDICIGRGLAAIRCSRAIESDFLFYFLLSVQKKIAGRDGAVFASIKKSDIESFVLPLPPLPEQHRIVDQLKVLNIKTKRLESLYQKKLLALEELKQSLLHQAFTGQLSRSVP